MADHAAATEVLREGGPIAVPDDEHWRRTVRWAAERRIGVVAGVRARKSARPAEAVDRAGLAIVTREDHRVGTLRARDPLPARSDPVGELGPADRLERVVVDCGHR